MDFSELDKMIDDLEGLVRERTGPLSIFTRGSEFITTPTELVIGFERHDWRPVWTKAQEIQAAFNARVRYPTKLLRDQAWTRFNDLRNNASACSNEEREKFRNMSVYYRDTIVSTAKEAEYSYFTDHTIGVIVGHTTIDQMKEKSAILKKAGQMLSENKDKMLREHKDECFAYFQEIRKTHDEFWERHNAVREQKIQAHKERMRNALSKLENNLHRNQDKKEKAEAALERVETNIDELRDKIDNAYTDGWRERFESWLSAAEEKRDSIKESIRQIEEWIQEDEARISDIQSKL